MFETRFLTSRKKACVRMAEGVRLDIFDVGSRQEFAKDFLSSDPISWPGYPQQLTRARATSGTDQAVSVGTARVGGVPCAFIEFNFKFLGGSLGWAEGQRIKAAFDHAINYRLPLVSVTASGGARMQEGTVALAQMQRIAESVGKARRAGAPHICVILDPTTGGVWASLAAPADLIIAVPDARIGFAGSRTMPAGSDPHGNAFHSKGKWESGFVDLLLAPEEVRGQLSIALVLLGQQSRGPQWSPANLPQVPAEDSGWNTDATAELAGWDQVVQARSPGRPRAQAYIDSYFESFVEIRGDRAGGVDSGIRCGFGRAQGRTVALIAQLGQPTSASGYRTALRLIQLAERFNLPIMSLVDTPGAPSDENAELEGVGTAISEMLIAMADARVPITSVIIGEGGSGGALALLAPDSTWMAEDSFLAVTAPELATAILKGSSSQVPTISDQLRLTPADQVALGLVRGVLRRPRP